MIIMLADELHAVLMLRDLLKVVKAASLDLDLVAAVRTAAA